MPMHFDRFRLLNGGSRFRNESEKTVYVSSLMLPDPIPVLPGEEVDLPPESGEGGVALDVENQEP